VESPEQRYASIHRAIERGLESDELWKDLALVSAELGHNEEALRCLGKIVNPHVLKTVEHRLRRQGLVNPKKGQSNAAAARMAKKETAGAAEAAHPGYTLSDHLVDALQYLFHQHMPLLVLVTTLAFPLILVAGGILTGGGVLLAAITAVPGACVFAVVGAMGRQILVASSEGNGDVPPLPSFQQIVTDARRFVVDGLVILTPLLGPGLITLVLGAPIATSLPPLLIGAFFVPLAWAFRQLHADFTALSPVRLLRGVTRGGKSYCGLAGVACGLFVPGALVTWFTWGSGLWVQIAAAGPLCVVPLFMASRLIGTWLDSNREVLGNVLTTAAGAEPAEPTESTDQPTQTTQPAQTTTPAVRAPKTAVPARSFDNSRQRPAPVPGTRKAKTAATPGQQPARTQQPAKAQQPAKTQQSAKAIEGREPQRPISADTPDLSNIPGARVLSGTERERSGAAAPVAHSASAPPMERQPFAKTQTRPAQPAKAIEGREPQRPITADQPDVSNIPGARVLSGTERERSGAAAPVAPGTPKK
jgi:hypothetical protein